MKKSALFLAAAACLVVPAVASAQTETATINAIARVQSSVAFSNPSDLDFGAAITPGTAATVTAANGGKIMVSYNTPTTITVAGTALNRAGGGSLAVTYSCAQAATGTATTPTAFAGTCGAGYTTAITGNARTDHWIYVGGDIAAGATTTAPAGNYTGTVTFTATYTTY